MATATAKLALQLPADGEPGWAAMLRQNFQILDQKAAGQNLVKTLTGGIYALSNSESACDSYEFNGVLTSNQTIVFPNNMSPFAIENLCTGGFQLTVKTALGIPRIIPSGALLLLYANGTNIETITMPAISQLASATTTSVGVAATTVALSAFTSNVGNNIISPNGITIVDAGVYLIKGRAGGLTSPVAQQLTVQIGKNNTLSFVKEIASNPTAVANYIAASVDAVLSLVAGDVITLQATGTVAAGVTLGIGQCSLIVEKVN